MDGIFRGPGAFPLPTPWTAVGPTQLFCLGEDLDLYLNVIRYPAVQ